MSKTIYRLGVKLAEKPGLHKTRIDRYLEVIEPYIDKCNIMLGLGCGSGAFAIRLRERKEKQVAALDIDCKAPRA